MQLLFYLDILRSCPNYSSIASSGSGSDNSLACSRAGSSYSTLLATPEAKVTVAGFTLLAFFAFLILGWVFLLFWTRANLYSFFFSTCLYLSLFRITRFDCWTNYLPYSTVLSIDDDLFGFDFWIFFPIVRFFLFFYTLIISFLT